METINIDVTSLMPDRACFYSAHGKPLHWVHCRCALSSIRERAKCTSLTSTSLARRTSNCSSQGVCSAYAAHPVSCLALRLGKLRELGRKPRVASRRHMDSAGHSRRPSQRASARVCCALARASEAAPLGLPNASG
eukprot:6208815-Pleurochrysis_carterae.AAC.2